MLKLYGFPVSNYYNKVKLALLEKEIPFEECLVTPNQSPELREKSPLGKIPFLETDQGILIESQVLVEYLEDAFPARPLLPKDPFQAAKVRELITFMELHLELVARELYMQAFFKGTTSTEMKARVEKLLARNSRAFERMVRFDPFIAGDNFTLADCAALFHLPLVGMATKIVFGEDLLGDLPIRDYVARMNQRPTVAKVVADRKKYQEQFKYAPKR